MVEGHRNADPVVFAVAKRFSDEVAVVEDVVVGEGGAFRKAGGAARVLDIDGVIELQPSLALGERLVRDLGGGRQQAFPVVFQDQARPEVRTA